MHADLIVRRRAVMTVYERFMEADRAWNEASAQMKAWLPDHDRPQHRLIGNPGSRMRRLYERRQRAVDQLEVAVLKLNLARTRLAKRKQTRVTVVALLPAPSV